MAANLALERFKSTARARVYGTVYVAVSPSTIVALVRTNEGPYRRQSLIQFPLSK